MMHVSTVSEALARSLSAPSATAMALLLFAAPASAATSAPATPPPPAAASSSAGIGVVSVLPAKGTDLIPLSLVTSAMCPSGGTNVFATIFGPGLPADGLNVVPNSTVTLYPHTAGGGLYLSSNNTLRNLVNELPDPPNLRGTYRVRVECRGPAKIADLGDFYGSMTFDGHHGYAVTEPNVTPASLVTIPVSEGPPIPTAIGSQAPQSAQTTSHAPAAVGTQVAASPVAATSSTKSLAPWLIVVGVLVVVGGLLTLLRGRSRATKAKSEAGS